MMYEAWRRRFVAERPIYLQLAEFAERVVLSTIREIGVTNCLVTSRAKDVHSFAKKLVRKAYDDPFGQMADLAGVRCTVTFERDVDVVREGLEREFVIIKVDDKRKKRSPNELDYSGVHLDVHVRGPYEGERGGFENRKCEIQLVSMAQSLFADVSHAFLYKREWSAGPPETVARKVFRLVALAEIVDETIADAERELRQSSALETTSVLETLEKHFYRRIVAEWDRGLSFHIIDGLVSRMMANERSQINATIEEFVSANGDKMEAIYEKYIEDDLCPIVLLQPESILVWAIAEQRPEWLEEAWAEILPVECLHEVREAWGAKV